MALNNIDLFFLLICDLDWAQQVSSALLLAPELEWPEQLGLVGNLPFLHDPFCQAGKLGRMAQGSKNKCSKGTDCASAQPVSAFIIIADSLTGQSKSRCPVWSQCGTA